ncbi:MAG: polyprenyl synthetase family protein [Ornithinimicrobium sp.]
MSSLPSATGPVASAVPLAPHPLDSVDLRARVDHALSAHVDAQRGIVAEVGEPVLALLDAISDLLSSGKRLRAAFLYWGYRAFDGSDSSALIRAASAMEVFQAAALLHDDVMDNSDLRRGRPTAHRAFAAQHADASWSGSSQSFGQAAATLAGDMCLNWCDEMFATSGLPTSHIQRARPTFDTMRTQLMGGQYLDVLTSAKEWEDLDHEQRLEQCRRVITYKSAKYSIEHPLLIGATAIAAPAPARAALSEYGLALGEAFQLRDDVLGVFGDPSQTGKPAGDDLREGKRTVLIAAGLHRGTDVQAQQIRDLLGKADLDLNQVDALRETLQSCGAVGDVEALIDQDCERARTALAAVPEITTEGHRALSSLIEVSTSRAS